MITVNFRARLEQPLETGATAFVLPEGKLDELLTEIPGEGDYTYLTVSDDRYVEVVKAMHHLGFVVLERGVGGTTARRFGYGSCVQALFGPEIALAVKDLICTYDCTQFCGEPCPCTAVTVGGQAIPEGRVGYPWQGTVVFNGTPPVVCGVSGIPSWMTAAQVGNAVVMQGVPNAAGSWVVSAAATNCNGAQIAPFAVTVTVTA